MTEQQIAARPFFAKQAERTACTRDKSGKSLGVPAISYCENSRSLHENLIGSREQGICESVG
jgi:hypothetical protein